uniref:Uncharacterized protein n=1 Tax=Rhizophora mucronata TaxID=61149 RepID=A0A2P2NQE1_RHIMU
MSGYTSDLCTTPLQICNLLPKPDKLTS